MPMKGPRPPAGAGQPVVHPPVGQPVGGPVHLPGNVLESHVLEPLHQPPGLLVQAKERGVLHPEPSRELLDQEAAVGANQDGASATASGGLQTGQHRAVLSHVIGGRPDPFGDLLERPAAPVGHHDTDPRRSGVPPSRAVRVDDHSSTRIRRQFSHLRMPSARFSRSRYSGDSFSWQPWHTPSTSLAAPTPFLLLRRSSYSSRSSSSNSGMSPSRSDRPRSSSAAISVSSRSALSSSRSSRSRASLSSASRAGSRPSSSSRRSICSSSSSSSLDFRN